MTFSGKIEDQGFTVAGHTNLTLVAHCRAIALP
jgi:hypothetical protein